MNTEQYRSYVNDLMAHLDGEVDAQAQERLDRQWRLSARDRAEYEEVAQMDKELAALAATQKAQAPEVDLLSGVLQRVQEEQQLSLCSDDSEEEEAVAMMAYLDGDLEEAQTLSFEARLKEEGGMAEEVAGLCEMETELRGIAATQIYPEVDLLDGIMAQLPAEEAISPDLIPELEAYAGGGLDATGFQRLEEAASDSPAFRESWDQLQALNDDLQAIADASIAATPPVDLLDGVMAKVHASRPSVENVVPFRARQRSISPSARRRAPRTLALGALVAACAMLVFGLMIWQVIDSAAPSEDLMHASHPSVAPSESSGTAQTHALIEMQEIPKPILFTQRSESEAGASTPEPSKRQAISLEDAIRARRLAAMKDEDARNQLEGWAALTAAEAQALQEQADLSLAARIGLSQFLSPEEAQAALAAALKENPEDPYLHFALAKLYADDADSYEAAMAELNQLSALDPENGLPYYMQANMAFAMGDVEGALAVLSAATQLPGADSYVMQAANYQDDALMASGLSPEVARFLAASEAGTDEYIMLTELGRELLQYGAYYENEGDYDTAEDIYSAVNEMGGQLVQSAAYVNEQLAGYDTQLAALDALNQIYEIIQEPEGQAVIVAAYNGIRAGLLGLGTIISGLDSLFSETQTQDIISEVVELSLEAGDISLWDSVN